ncbi:Os10g0144800 [Oryza sativa Japonica Group]|uniref:Os10g0144800 protein n=1 Tax=Oryza sativa subsp. japonica TaxID=39947 RepID=A0A0P0XSB9_ORYSJ|nr:Os10g0144800 [Oryza sativa Japonica Group]
MSLSRPLAAAAAATVPDELHLEIMVRLPALPQALARASAVCPEWRRVVRDAAFLRRHRELHGGVPATAGFFHNTVVFGGAPGGARFVCAGAGPLALSVPPSVSRQGVPCCHTHVNPGDAWTVLDCRGGRVLLGCCRFSCYFLVYNPITGKRCLVKAASHKRLHLHHSIRCNATLICDDDDADADGPFRVAAVYTTVTDGGRLFGAAFLSRTGRWTTAPQVFVDLPRGIDLRGEPSAVVGSTAYLSAYSYLVLAFDVEHWTMATFQRPPRCGNARLMKTRGDGVLGLVGALELTVRLWAREAGGWVLRSTVELSDMGLLRDLPSAPLPSSDARFPLLPPVKIIGVAEEGDAVFLWTMLGIFMFCPGSMELKKVCEETRDIEMKAVKKQQNRVDMLQQMSLKINDEASMIYVG